MSISANCEQLSITSISGRIPEHQAFPLSGGFPFYFGRSLVFAQPEKHRLAKLSVAGPLRKLDFGNELRIYPVHLFHHRRGDSLHPDTTLFGRKVDKRTIVALFFAKFSVQGRQRL